MNKLIVNVRKSKASHFYNRFCEWQTHIYVRTARALILNDSREILNLNIGA